MFFGAVALLSVACLEELGAARVVYRAEQEPAEDVEPPTEPPTEQSAAVPAAEEPTEEPTEEPASLVGGGTKIVPPVLRRSPLAQPRPSMKKAQESLMQTLLDGVESPLELKTKHESELTRGLLQVFNHAEPIGIAPGYSKSGGLVALAIADDTYCLIVQFYNNRGNQKPQHGKGAGRQPESAPKARDLSGRKILEEIILCRTAGDLLAFDLGPLSMSLYCGVDLRLTNGIDIQSAFSAIDRRPLSAIKAAVGSNMKVFEDNVKAVFENPIYSDTDKHCTVDLAMRAWISQYLITVSNGAETFSKVEKINTQKLEPQLLFKTLAILAKMTQDSLRQTHLKPMQTKHEFVTTHNFDGLGVQSASFNNRLRHSQDVRVLMRNDHGHGYTVHTQTGGVDGKTVNLDVPRPLDNSKTILMIKSIGRDDPTTAEAKRAAAVLRILQGHLELLGDNPWMQNIWLPSADDLLVWPPGWSELAEAPPASGDNLDRRNLNKSQQVAVNAMLSRSDTNRIVIVQGPPGTGKTSVIAAYVTAAIEQHHPGIWLVAKSNVAVINIAMKDFSHADWHGHLYEGIRANFIRSDEFRTMSDSRIRGCKLSNDWIGRKFAKQIPIHTIIVDEASQIEIGDYIPVFTKFHSSLRKMCFIGDDKQLPPYGQEDLQDLQSIFEITHLQRLSLFLDTQFYEGKLKSNPQHPISDSIIACQFINVVGAKEQKQATGTSLFNTLESEAVLTLAQHLQEHAKSYKIITPYDGQRVLIEDRMKKMEGLTWEEKVYNVDSFQVFLGNEEDFIIISLVRSMSLGFLQNLRRTNVMLTRCKRGMYIVTSQAFLHNGVGKDSIVGELSKYVGDIGWLEMKDIEDGNFLDNPRKQAIKV
ncbi:P-loop containing nucleoside triphosphate hydrolase protein [Mycena pura]|uniref:P-loop containing nucleoside triphosphate hydrolase protein n=1 Tax=Mycena pura TaxID=153505 RepID=A0AAD7E4R9_9AGAR|nr:P-loop containing nucleoside triphosphate hydrolase protein [Mycena pura]